MATNTWNRGRVFNVAVTAGFVSGDPEVIGPLPGVLQTSRDSAGNADVEFDRVLVGYTLTCEAVIAGAVASAIAVGDILYHDGTTTLNKDNAGEEYGVAFSTLGGGATGAVNVILMSSG